MKKRYSKQDKWIRISYSKPHRRRQAIKHCQASLFLAVQQVNMQAIMRSGRPDAVIGMAKCSVETATGLSRINKKLDALPN